MARQMKDSGVEWIGEIPEGWEIKKLKYVSSFIQKKYVESYGNLPYIGLENIVSWNGSYIETDSLYDREQSIICEPGDILFGKLRPYLAKVYMNPSLQCCSGEFAVIRINEQHSRYMWYQLLSHGFIFTVDRSTYGTKMPRANADFIKNITIAVPTFPEQRRIAAFLDRRCAEIDAVIERTRATIEEYKKLKQAVITEAVTKGVRGERKMKDSGIEWIGEIPEEWEVLPHKYVMHKEKSICEHYAGEDIISLTMNGVIVRDLTAGGKMPTTFDGYQYVEPDDMLLCLFDIDVTPRCVGIVRNHGVTSPAYSRFKVHVGYYNAYYDYLLRFIDDEKAFIHLSKNLRSSLTETDFGAIKTISPSYDEQVEIAAYLDEKCAALDTLIAKKTALLTELETYKKSLIYEYVTGKKEVPACP